MMGILYGIVDEQEWLGTICYQLWWAHVMLGENLKINSKIIWRKDLFNNLIRNYGRDWIICFHRNHLLWKYILFSTQSQHMFSWSEYIGIGWGSWEFQPIRRHISFCWSIKVHIPHWNYAWAPGQLLYRSGALYLYWATICNIFLIV